MTTSKKGNKVFVSPPPDSLFSVGSVPIAADGQNATFVLPNSKLQQLVTDANRLGLKAYALSFAFKITQDYTMPAVGADPDLFASAIARLSEWTLEIDTPKISQRFFGDNCRSLGLVAQFCREIINPSICLKVESRFRNGLVKRTSSSKTITAGANDTYSDSFTGCGQDPDGSFGSQEWQMAPVSLTAGGSRSDIKSPHSQYDLIAVPLCRAASADGGLNGTNDAAEGEPLIALTSKDTGYTLVVTRNDLTAAYAAGTTFGTATVELFVMVRYYRKGRDKRALGCGYYVMTTPAAAPYLVPPDFRVLSIFSGPIYGKRAGTINTGNQILSSGYLPQNYFASVGATAKLYWTEVRDGAPTIVFPVSRDQQHPYNVITDVVNTPGETGLRAARRHMRMPLETPNVASDPWLGATSTVVSQFTAGAVTPANVGLGQSQLSVMTHGVSGLWRLPLCESIPAQRGMPGGPMNTGDIANIQAVATFSDMPAFNPGNTLYCVRDSGVVKPDTLSGFVNATTLDVTDVTPPAEDAGVPMPDSKNSPRNEAIVATGMIPVSIPDSSEE